MEELGILFAFALLAVVIILPIWLVINVMRLRRQADDEQRLNTTRWQDLTARLYLLETQFRELKQRPAAGHQAVSETVATAPPSTAPPHEQAGAPLAEQVPKKLATPATQPASAPSIPAKAPEPARPAGTPPTATPPPLPARAEIPLPTPPFIRPAPQPTRSSFDIEEMLGTNWLNKIGIGILVLGLAFFLAYQLQNLGPAGKVLLGLALSAVMIAAGVRYESSERYRILARAGAAGGWALLYFISYAVYHVSAAKVIDSRELDFLLMIVVAAAIVWYSLRYRSQTTTALAFVLSYLTVGVHHTSVYGLAASVILALTVVALALRMKWFALELFAILATYFNHFLWVRPVIEAMGPNRIRFAEFNTSVALLGFYWLLFRFSYIYRKPSDEEERISTASALVNGFCLLALLRYQSLHPEWAFWALLVLGAVELALSVLAARRRRVAFIVLATLGSALLVAAFPFRYSGSNLSVLWLMAAETFLLAGIFIREIVFRRIGMITIAVVAAQMVFDTGASLLESRLTSGTGAPIYTTAVLFAVGAALCYLNSHWIRIRWRDLFLHDFDATVMDSLTYAGGLLGLLALWFAFPGMCTAVVWALFALLLDVAGKQFRQIPLAIQGNIVAVIAIIRLVTLNFSSAEQWHGLSLRLVTVSLTALLLYAAAPFARMADGEDGIWAVLAASYTWVASTLLGVLIWYEVSFLNVALAWMALGIVLMEIALALRAKFLLWQGFTALAASFARIFFVNLVETGVPGQISPRVWRLLVIGAAYVYTDWRLRRAAVASKHEDLQTAGGLFSYAGTITFAALLFVEVQEAWIAAAWAGLAVIMIAASYRQQRSDYLHQSFLLALAVTLRVVTYNFFQPGPADSSFWFSQKYYVGAAITLLFAALPIAFALRRSGFGTPRSDFLFDRRPEQIFFFIPFGLLIALTAVESSRGYLTLSWGVEALAVFLFALLVGERSFRLAGLSLLLLCVVKIFLVDVWGLDPQSRYITLIVLGGALVLVSFLYSRHKEKFRRYL